MPHQILCPDIAAPSAATGNTTTGSTGWMTLCVLTAWVVAPAALQAQVTMTEDAQSPRVYATEMTATVAGKLSTPRLGAEPTVVPLEVEATASFFERRLPPAGRDERACRAVRHYERCSAQIKTGPEPVTESLPPNLKEIVVEGSRRGPLLYAPKVVLSRSALDMLEMPGDPVGTYGMLPKKPVAVGENWKPDDWVLPMLASVEAVTKSQLNCQLVSVESDVARITFEGAVSGAVAGATTEVTVTGTLLFHTKDGYVAGLDLEQKEKRAIGSVNPGMDVTAKVVFRRQPATATPLDAFDPASVSLDPGRAAEILTFQSAQWRLRFFHGRNWHVFQDIPSVVVLRMVHEGSLVAQCNASLIGRKPAGKHTTTDEFVADIKRSLGEKLTEVVATEEVSTGDSRYLFRAKVAGTANGIDMRWHYYLLANPDGRQVSFVFALEPTGEQTLAEQDLAIVSSVQFLPE